MIARKLPRIPSSQIVIDKANFESVFPLLMKEGVRGWFGVREKIPTSPLIPSFIRRGKSQHQFILFEFFNH